MKWVNFARFEGEERWKEGKLGMGAGARETKRDEMGMGMATLFLRMGSYEQQTISDFPGCGKRARKNGAGIRYQVSGRNERDETSREKKERKGRTGNPREQQENHRHGKSRQGDEGRKGRQAKPPTPTPKPKPKPKPGHLG